MHEGQASHELAKAEILPARPQVESRLNHNIWHAKECSEESIWVTPNYPCDGLQTRDRAAVQSCIHAYRDLYVSIKKQYLTGLYQHFFFNSVRLCPHAPFYAVAYERNPNPQYPRCRTSVSGASDSKSESKLT